MRHQSGFTLIELIIVIVILGILAVTAAPKFIDIQSDATASTLKGVQAALQGGSQLVYAKSAIAGEQKNANANDDLTTRTDDVDIAGVVVETEFGYPSGEEADATSLNGWVSVAATDFTFVLGAGVAATASPALGDFGLSPAGTTPDYSVTTSTGASCHVVYSASTSAGVAPVITVVDGGC
jgi:MSHA pilin protein MshA